MAFCFKRENCRSIFISLMFMKRIILVSYLLLLSCALFAQESKKAYKNGEWLEYKMSYSGFLKAGTATLE